MCKLICPSLFGLTGQTLSTSFTETMPQTPVEIKYPERDFKVVWNRLKNGVLSKYGRNILYLIIHERTFTRQRGFRLLPRKYDSPNCQFCGLEDTVTHKYATCLKVKEAWGKLRDILQQLDSLFIFESDHSILNLYFPKLTRENASIWLVGKFVEIVEKEVYINGKVLSGDNLMGWLMAQLSCCRFQSMPSLRSIPGIQRAGIG